ncbi:MAG: Holliday junction branch migration protein RuvA, partial [Candidatus Omnitrophica bacterium]|nr:Holliday junction branch migration protein RuvA [Candidatus Omnitrophota bacterium]
MIYKLKGKLVKKEDHRVIIDVNGIFYEVNIPQTVARNLKPDANNNVELIIYHYL